MTSLLPTHISAQAAWRPFLLPEGVKKEALSALHAIAHALPGPQDGHIGANLAGGHAGLAVFHAYYSASGLDGHDHRGLAVAHLESAVSLLPHYADSPGLYGGFTGAAWAVDHLESMGLFEAEEDLNEDIDAALITELTRRPYVGLCEIINGISGYGFYGLDRGARGQGRQVALAALETLEAAAEKQDGLITWFNAPEALHPLALETHPNGCHNLGLSHGVPGAIGFLAEAVSAGIDAARPLLNGSVEWLLAQAGEHANGSRFGYSVGETHKAHGSRLAWCYGDLGIAAVLMLTARRAGRADWEAEALKLAQACAARPLDGAGVMDAGLCHGSIGNAHIFHRLWQATGDPALEKAALDWLRHGLEMRKPGEPFGGFLAWHAPAPGSRETAYVPDPSLLEGAAGIGLALLAFLAPQEPNWDRFLFVHVPPRA